MPHLIEYQKPNNVNVIVYALVVGELATYRELVRDYTEWEILDLYEILIIRGNNTQIQQYNIKNSRGK